MDDIDFLHGGNIYEVKQKYKKEVIDFSANINPLGLPPSIKKAIYRNFDRILHYPDPHAVNITQKIAEYWDIDEKNILLGNGSIELIYLIVSTFKPKSTFIPVPTFSEYERAAKIAKSKVRFLKLEEKENFNVTLSCLQLDGADICFLCNPNNPTGNFILENRNAVEGLVSKLIVIDEAFMDFVPNEKNFTLIQKAVKSRKIIVLRTFTKFFALPGLRMGYLIAHKEIIDKLRQCLPPWNTNSLVQLAAELILNDREYIEKTHKLIEKERRFLFEQLAKIKGLRPYPSVANFLLLKIERGSVDAASLRKKLLARGILVRDCGNFRNLTSRFIRVAVRKRSENIRLIAALKGIL